VAEAIKTISPWGVDVSTGVETKGVKDLVKIKKFIAAVRKADGKA
jgi:phosphoribosylanthranilate isomerase